jgi:uncharacterized membrane protein YhiD involved in acid resistance
MQEWFQQTITANHHGSIGDLFWKIALAALLGGVVALIYKATHRTDPITPTFPRTLVLLAILIAMVTQVIGDNVARAFSLVGALSIVRFRTVVRDTQDTAFVIFSVIVGMAIGANHLWVALVGMVVIGITVWILRPSGTPVAWSAEECILSLRVGIGTKPEDILRGLFAKYIERYEVISAATARQGVALELSYRLSFKAQCDPLKLVEEMNKIEGVQNIELRRATE